MAKYRKKPVVIEAVQWFNLGDHPSVWQHYSDKNPELFCEQCNQAWKNHGKCSTLEGYHIVCPGDWIITGIRNERYPCKPDIFQATYELVEE